MTLCSAPNIVAAALSFVFIFYNVYGELAELGLSSNDSKNFTCPDPDIKFLLYTSKNKNEPQEIQPSGNEISKSFFQPNSVNKIIIHGFNSTPNHEQLINMKNGYLETSDHNVWLVDWSKLAKGQILLDYWIVRYRLNRVGACIAQLIREITNVSTANPETAFHVLGYSLGAHAAAYTANHLRPYKLPRITGLDPASVLFFTLRQDSKLDKTDAHFVDVLHTNAYIEGKSGRCGHVDFYLNGGTLQPGCYENKHVTDLLEASQCSHSRAPAYFAESITTKLGFYGWPCKSLRDYNQGKYPPKIPDTLMGEYCNVNSTGSFVVQTAAKPPYAIGKKYTELNDNEIPVELPNDLGGDSTNFFLAYLADFRCTKAKFVKYAILFIIYGGVAYVLSRLCAC